MEIILYLFILLCLHEFAHYLFAIFNKIEVLKIGCTLVPIPHPYIMVRGIQTRKQLIGFYFAGIACTVLLFVVLLLSPYGIDKNVYYAFCLMSALETNPYYSDITLFKKEYRNREDAQINKLHVILWFLWISLLFTPNGLPALLL